MTSFLDNGVWDKNGVCVDCGYMPFELTDNCFVCNPPTNTSDDDTNNSFEDSYDIEHTQVPVTWEINSEKSIVIDEDKSTYEEMFQALEQHNERGDTERIHIVEDQIYRRFIKDIALKKFTNIDTIILAANKINDIIIKPNDGTWDTCRWYA
jgi:hypothetical protein